VAPKPTPKPSPTEDSTLQRPITQQKQDEQNKKEQQKKVAQQEAIKNKQKNIVNQLLNTKLKNVSTPDFTVSGLYSRGQYEAKDFENTLLQLKKDRDLIGSNDSTVDINARKKQFAQNKKVLLSFIRSWEKKNKRSVLDVLSYGVDIRTKDKTLGPFVTGQEGLSPSEIVDTQFLHELMSDNPDPKQKFIQPKVFEANTLLPNKGAFQEPTRTVPNAPTAPDYVEPGTGTATSMPYKGTYKWDIATDNQGNIINYWMGNGDAGIGVAFLGDEATGNYLLHNKNYNRALQGMNLDPLSPQTENEAFAYIVNQLQSPKNAGALRKFKQLAIAKRIIPADKVQLVLKDPDALDSVTTSAIQQVIALTTAHNIALSKMGKPNQKFLSFNKFLDYMNPLSESQITRQTKRTVITPQDYELSIDQMFQNVLGRGATQQELQTFTKQLQAYANAHPETTTTTTIPNANGKVASDVTVSETTSGGITSQGSAAMMRDQALNTAGAKEFTQGSKYFDWFQQAISGQNQVGR